MVLPVRFGGFTLRINCNHCGQPVPLNAPAHEVNCSSCLQDIAIPNEVWESPLNDFEDSQDRGEVGSLTRSRDIAGFQLHYDYQEAIPKCGHCGLPHLVARVVAGGELRCECGQLAGMSAAPDWLRSLVPTAAEIVVTDPSLAPSAAPDGAATPAIARAAAPVVMACPQCGASLRITSEMARVCPCAFCKTDVYLPDDLWRRLHPAKVVREWYVCFRGKTRGQLNAEARAQFEKTGLEQKRAEEQRVYDAGVAKDRERDAEVARVMPRAYGMVGALYLLAIAATAWNFASSAMGAPSPTVALVLQGGIVLFIAAAFYATSQPLIRRTGHGDDMILFTSIFAAVMPVVGQIMSIALAVKRFGGAFGGASALDGGESYPSVQLKGESVPIALVYLALALLWPASVGSVVYAYSTEAAAPTVHSAPASPPSPASQPSHGKRGR
jgi:hypothetical protein